MPSSATCWWAEVISARRAARACAAAALARAARAMLGLARLRFRLALTLARRGLLSRRGLRAELCRVGQIDRLAGRIALRALGLIRGRPRA